MTENCIQSECEKKKSVAEKMIKNMQYERDFMEEKIESQEKLLDLLYDDIEKKNKEIEYLKNKMASMAVNNEEIAKFEKRKKEFDVLCRELDSKNKNRMEEMEKLKLGIKALAHKSEKPKERCFYEWKCKNIVCRFDHSFLNFKRNSHPIISTALARFPCPFCKKILESETDLDKHKTKQHGEIQGNSENCVPCDLCKEVLKSKSHLSKHVEKNHGSVHVECTKCGKYFVSENEVRYHMKKHSEDEKFMRDLANRLESVINKTDEAQTKEPAKTKFMKKKEAPKRQNTLKKNRVKVIKPNHHAERGYFEELERSNEVDVDDISDESLNESEEDDSSTISESPETSREESGEDTEDAIQ